jgi:cytochrome P450
MPGVALQHEAQLRTAQEEAMTTTAKCPVLEFDHHSEYVSEHRPEVLEMVRQHPVFFTESHGGYWVVAGYDVARQVLRDTEHFSSLKHDDGSGGVTVPTAIGPRFLPAEIDGDYHMRLKRILTANFDRKSVERLRPLIEASVTSALDAIIAKGEFDVVHDLADVVPAGVTVRMLGFTEDQRVPFVKAVQDAVAAIPKVGMPEGGPTPEMLAAAESFQTAIDMIDTLVSQRRQKPEDDLVSALVAPQHGLNDEEVRWMTFTLILGGAENPAALIANTLLRISQDSGLRARLMEQPDLIPKVVDELLREITPGMSLGRNVIKDVEVGGQVLRAEDRVIIWLPAANHDPAVFDHPDEFDIDRAKCPHIAFGVGPHSCPGSWFARMEIELVLRQVLERMPDFVIDVTRSKRFENASLAYCFRDMPATTGLSH